MTYTVRLPRRLGVYTPRDSAFDFFSTAYPVTRKESVVRFDGTRSTANYYVCADVSPMPHEIENTAVKLLALL